MVAISAANCVVIATLALGRGHARPRRRTDALAIQRAGIPPIDLAGGSYALPDRPHRSIDVLVRRPRATSSWPSRLGLAIRLRAADAVSLQLQNQRTPRDVQNLRGGGLVVGAAIQRRHDSLPLLALG